MFLLNSRFIKFLFCTNRKESVLISHYCC